MSDRASTRAHARVISRCTRRWRTSFPQCPPRRRGGHWAVGGRGGGHRLAAARATSDAKRLKTSIGSARVVGTPNGEGFKASHGRRWLGDPHAPPPSGGQKPEKPPPPAGTAVVPVHGEAVAARERDHVPGQAER